ncbi:MAG: hypothetical protein ACM3NI_06875 [Bacteroidota bacterium]
MIPRLTLTRAWRAAAGLLLIGALGACVGPAREPVDSLSGLDRDETVVVGRIELVPPLRKGEQKFKGIVIGDLKNKMILITNDHYRTLTDEPGMSDFSGRIEAKLGKTFFVRSQSKSFYILGGMLFLDLGGEETNRAYFPGGLKVSLKPGEKAVYVGTVRYNRNEFFEITKASIVDDYERANTEFKKKFGTRYPLHKALLTPVK